MTPENLSRAEIEARAGRELTDAELEAIAAGKEFLSKSDPGFNSGRGRGMGWGWGGAFANNRRPLPGRGGRLASNVTNSGAGYA